MTDNSDKLLPKDLKTLFPDFSEDGDAEWIAEHLERKGKPVIIIEGFETKEQAIQFWCDMGSSCVENRVLKEIGARHQPTLGDTPLKTAPMKDHHANIVGRQLLDKLPPVSGDHQPTPSDSELVEVLEVAIAEEYMLIPNKSTWEERSERLAKAALKALKPYLKGVRDGY